MKKVDRVSIKFYLKEQAVAGAPAGSVIGHEKHYWRSVRKMEDIVTLPMLCVKKVIWPWKDERVDEEEKGNKIHGKGQR
jgi:hypothetical protein